MSEERAGIIAKLDTETKVLGLIALVAEALFLGALTVLRDEYLLRALLACAAILLVTIIGIVLVKVTQARTDRAGRQDLVPSPLTPQSDFLNELINTSIQTVCRAVSLPSTPQNAKLRVFIFRKERSQLVCSHFWSQDRVREQVGRLRFDLTPEVAKRVAVVRAVLNDCICRTEVEPLPSEIKNSTGDVADDFTFVVAAPIKGRDDEVLGSVDFDAASDEGRALLSHEVSNAVMYQLARHLAVVFSLERRQKAAG